VGAVAQQLLFGSADVDLPMVEDLQGLLCGPGEIVRLGGTARLSIVVADPWRVGALLELLRERDLTGDTAVAEGGGTSVRTPFSALLGPLAQRWTRGATQAPPARLQLSGAALRAWVLAAGSPVPGGFELALGPYDTSHAAVKDALTRAGLASTVRPAGPALRVTSARRLHRLAELVGQPPQVAPPGCWPVTATP
jgi:hypothetical protein